MTTVFMKQPNQDISVYVTEAASKSGKSLIEDPARAVCESLGYQTLYEIPSMQQIQVRKDLIQIHLDQLQSNTGAVFDHSVMNYLSDWMRWSWSDTTTEVWDEVITLAKKCTEFYESVYVCSNAPLAGYDGYTWLDKRNAEQQAELNRFMLEKFDLGGACKEYEAS